MFELLFVQENAFRARLKREELPTTGFTNVKSVLTRECTKLKVQDDDLNDYAGYVYERSEGRGLEGTGRR